MCTIASRRPLRRTIADNIAYGMPTDVDGTSMDKIMEAAELANARDFIEEFPEGYSFNIYIIISYDPSPRH